MEIVKNSLFVTPYKTNFAAEIEGVDLTKPIDDRTFNFIYDCFIKYKVIFFRNQKISSQNHRDLALRFGEPHTHPAYNTVEGFPELTILESQKHKPTKIDTWHIDMTFSPTPPLGSILRAYEIPPVGGDTMWSDTQAAFEALDPEMQEYLSTLKAVHSFEFGFKESLAEEGGRERLKEALEKYPPITHPVVRTHPVTGKKGLFISRLFTIAIEGLEQKDSDELINTLCDHMIKDDFTYRFKWEKDSIAIWDNRCTKHVPVNDYFPQYRQMRRITIKGDVPF